MKKYRKVKTRKINRRRNCRPRKNLRAGSKAVKRRLLELNPHCDICGSTKNLQLHHVYLIRHGFSTQIDHCCLLCSVCHPDFHHRWDKYLDEVFRQNKEADFLAIYNELKKL